MSISRFLNLILLLTISNTVFAQKIFSDNKYPISDFRSPLDIQPPALAGSFGELRSNHFHSGADFRTNQRIGYPVYAVADGYISRIRVQNSGFGLALYINHPNGYTSVYAHLSRFNPKIGQEVKDIQYRLKSYEIDEFPKSDIIPIRKGDIIAYSGNSGSSGGPHLHFEIRESKTEATINPQLLGIEIPDQIPPVISSMYVYRLNEQPFSEYTPKQYFQVVGGNGKFSLNKVQTINLYGEVGFGIVTTDKHNGQSGTNGVYSIELLVDGTTIFTSALERFSFANSRAINSHIDYPAFITFKRSVQKSFVDPGNPLQIYSNLVNNGRISFSDGKLHQVEYRVSDSRGNKSVLKFNVQSNSKALISSPPPVAGIPFSYQKSNEFSNDEIKINIPKGSLYSDINFIYKKLNGNNHQIHNSLTPLHNGFELWLKVDSSLVKNVTKAVVVNSSRVSQGGIYENGYLKANPKTFGTFSIAIDSIAPVITPLNIAPGKNLNDVAAIRFTIRDQLSGIKSFNGYIDGKWVLMEFDAKTASLWHNFDSRTTAGKHVFELVVIDMKDNIKKVSYEFFK